MMRIRQQLNTRNTAEIEKEKGRTTITSINTLHITFYRPAKKCFLHFELKSLIVVKKGTIVTKLSLASKEKES